MFSQEKVILLRPPWEYAEVAWRMLLWNASTYIPFSILSYARRQESSVQFLSTWTVTFITSTLLFIICTLKLTKVLVFFVRYIITFLTLFHTAWSTMSLFAWDSRAINMMFTWSNGIWLASLDKNVKYYDIYSQDIHKTVTVKGFLYAAQQSCWKNINIWSQKG